MKDKIEEYSHPDFSDKKFKDSKEIVTKKVLEDGIAPKGFYLTSHMPSYYYYRGEWIIPRYNSRNCAAILQDKKIVIKELRDLKEGDLVVITRAIDGSEGVYVNKEGFSKSIYSKTGKAVETSFSQDYKFLFEKMKYEKENNGNIIWVLGPSVVFDHDTRKSLNRLAENGYIDCVLGGNAMATHDLEGGYLNTSLGQNIYTQENMEMGHYNHLDLLNEVRDAGSIDNFIDSGRVKDGLMKTLVENNIPYILAGSIRDDGPLPEVDGNISRVLNTKKEYLNKGTLIIGLATLLHNLSTANMASSYNMDEDGNIRPVYMCGVDITENVVNKIGAARENLAYIPMVTNVQDFVVNLDRALIGEEI